MFTCLLAEEKKYDAATFRAARENLRAGRYEAADQQMSSYIKGSLGMFQYVADLALVYSPAPISWKKEEDMTHVAAPAVAAKDGKGKHPLPKRVPNFRRPRQPGRLGLLRSMNERLTFHPLQSVTPLRQQSAPAQALAGQRQPFGDVLVSDGILDLQSGIAYTSIAERPVNAKEGQPTSKAVQDKLLRHHHREWFASAHDDVMVGSLSCKSSVTTDEACLNAALQLHREHDPELVPEIQFSAAPLTMTEAQRSKWLPNVMTGKPKPSVQAIEFAIVLSGTISVQVPTTVTTGVVVCIGNSGGAMNLSQHAMEDASSVLICNNAAHMYVVLTIQSNGNTFTTASPPSKSVAQLTSEADERVKKALDKGFVLLRRDHAREFSEKMSRVDLRLESPKSALNSRTCTASPLDHRLESFRDGCVTSSTSAAHGIVSLNQKRQEGGPRGEAVDAKLAAQLFQYGRYLLLSSASGAVANLQGLWADGPTSAWNGDYHLNINLQMAYWAADTVRLSEAMEPLRGFVQQLQRKGEVCSMCSCVLTIRAVPCDDNNFRTWITRNVLHFQSDLLCIYVTGTEVASQMYGCTDPRAWMAHGFLDDELDGFPHGDNQWALCVSCGAWAALSIWEHLITQPFDAAVLMEVVGSLRGVALFFREYMWAEETGDEKEASSGGHSSTGTRMHTGPTTSPENSFVLLYSGMIFKSRNFVVLQRYLKSV